MGGNSSKVNQESSNATRARSTNAKPGPIGTIDSTAILRTALATVESGKDNIDLSGMKIVYYKFCFLKSVLSSLLLLILHLGIYLGPERFKTVISSICKAKPSVLNVSCCGLTNSGIIALLSQSPIQKSVKVLNIADNSLTSDICKQLGKLLAKFSSLRELVIKSNNFGAGMKDFLSSFRASHLVKFDCSSINVFPQYF